MLNYARLYGSGERHSVDELEKSGVKREVRKTYLGDWRKWNLRCLEVIDKIHRKRNERRDSSSHSRREIGDSELYL